MDYFLEPYHPSRVKLSLLDQVIEVNCVGSGRLLGGCPGRWLGGWLDGWLGDWLGGWLGGGPGRWLGKIDIKAW